MLVAQGYLQVEYLFAVALEAEVARLDDARVNGADGDLMDLVPLDPIEIHDADDGDLARLPAPRVVTGPIGSMEAHRLEPRVAFRVDAVLLSDFPLEYTVRLKK